ncbi:hypothetical protein [Nannocystis bainbridge]|uniref:Uncharacterized protein n=1 Tax=Nannocystis bainbridge TaxID=2995303 RepID=A0ABT5E5P5_9BACT|nr:hypothetical protein [Nannocystis bainbridge]MDC0721174.1 hypothetical protein [Nannocystis bainbridge]
MNTAATPCEAETGRARPSRARQLATFAALLVASVSVMATSKPRWHLDSSATGAPMEVAPSSSKSANIVVAVAHATAPGESISDWLVTVRVTTKTPTSGGAGQVRLSLQSPAGQAADAPASSTGPTDQVSVSTTVYSPKCPPEGPCELRFTLSAEGVGGTVRVEPTVSAWLRGDGTVVPPGAGITVRVDPTP